MTDEELENNIKVLISLLENCNYSDPFIARASHKKVIKAYDILFNMQKKLERKAKNETN